MYESFVKYRMGDSNKRSSYASDVNSRFTTPEKLVHENVYCQREDVEKDSDVRKEFLPYKKKSTRNSENLSEKNPNEKLSKSICCRTEGKENVDS